MAIELQKLKRTRHTLFFAHLTVEKILKALICKNTNDLAPRIHNLIRLAETAGIELTETQKDTLAEMNSFNLEGRYPAPSIAPPSIEIVNDFILKIEEIKEWLILLLKK